MSLPTQVTLPPGVYTVLIPGVNFQDGSDKALTNPADNGKPFTIEDYDPKNTNQQFIVNGSGLIFASFNRNSLAYSQIPSLLQERVRRSTTGVGWLIGVEPVPGGWKGYILTPDENKYYWNPDYDEESVKLSRTVYKEWIFIPVPNPAST